MSTTNPVEERIDRTTVVRDVLIFQGKLWLEGFKDVVLIPLSLGAALIDLIFLRSRRGRALYGVMRFGDRFERWVNLYGALDGATEGERAPTHATLRSRGRDERVEESQRMPEARVHQR